MDITIDQARAFEAVIRCGTILAAAKDLHKGHSAIMYLLKALENQTNLNLFDRSGYRNQITLEGEIVLKYCMQLIRTQEELGQICKKLQGGWEPSLKLIYDGVIDFNLIGDALQRLNHSQVPTEVKVLSAYLHEVEAQFEAEDADLMVTILPIKRPNIFSIRLKPIRMLLVTHKGHPLAKRGRKKISVSDLKNHTYIKIRDTTDSLDLSTEQLDLTSSFSVNDFATKKQALMRNLGYGWLPEYMIESEIKSKAIHVLKTEIESEHYLTPSLYHRKLDVAGKTTSELIKYFKEHR